MAEGTGKISGMAVLFCMLICCCSYLQGEGPNACVLTARTPQTPWTSFSCAPCPVCSTVVYADAVPSTSLRVLLRFLCPSSSFCVPSSNSAHSNLQGIVPDSLYSCAHAHTDLEVPQSLCPYKAVGGRQLNGAEGWKPSMILSTGFHLMELPCLASSPFLT